MLSWLNPDLKYDREVSVQMKYNILKSLNNSKLLKHHAYLEDQKQKKTNKQNTQAGVTEPQPIHPGCACPR